MIYIASIVCLVAGICVGLMVGGFVAGSARPCRGCNEAPYKIEIPEGVDVLVREVLGQ